MPTVVQIVRNDGTLRTPTVEDMANLIASQAIQLATHGRIAPIENDPVTRRCIAAGRPVAAKGFGKGPNSWLESKPSTSRIDSELRSLLIEG
jgi:hypothetical protein